MPIGPSLPPHLAKRSREDHEDGSSSPESSEKRRRVLGPVPPPLKPSPSRVLGPSLPPQSRSRSSSPEHDIASTPPTKPKLARVLGPAPPPAPLDERPPNPPSDDSDSSDDDFGPAPPPPGATYDAYENEPEAPSAYPPLDTNHTHSVETKKAERDAWMTMPPSHDDLARIDPTKTRPRKFNTGKSAGRSDPGGMGVWTETPEQKLKRLQDEAMGISAPANAASSNKDSRKSRDEEEKARRMREKIDATRGKSLMEQHKEKAGKDKEDDPSKRVFDYEKDMATGTKISHKQRRDMLSNAKGFGDRFSSGSFL